MTEFNKVEVLIDLMKKSLGDNFNQAEAEKFAAYCLRLKLELKDGKPKNPWMQKKDVEQLDGLYRRVLNEGLIFDGVHVTLQSTGISYDYQAYKNKMFVAYPETYIDIQLVYEGDTFSFSKESGKVTYQHKIANPFSQPDDKIIGGYCVVKNKRGEFLTTLSKDRIDDHRKIAKTDYIWKAWFPEMCMKTIIRKATKYHFDDVFSTMNEVDNDQYDLEQSGKSRLEVLNKRIVDLLDVYQGEDIVGIRNECRQAKEKNKFTEEFAEAIVIKLGGEI